MRLGRTAVRCGECEPTIREIDQIWLDGRPLPDTLRQYNIQRQEDYKLWCVCCAECLACSPISYVMRDMTTMH